jgi:hypothetical protein
VGGVLPLHLPDIRRIRFGARLNRVPDVEDVFERRVLRVRGVDERYALRATFNPAIHPLIPEVYGGAGRRSGTLRVDQRLIHE